MHTHIMFKLLNSSIESREVALLKVHLKNNRYLLHISITKTALNHASVSYRLPFSVGKIM